MHSRQHRQVPAMSRLSKIHMVIMIIVFLVLHIRAADDKEEMNKVAAAMVKNRHRAAGKTTKAQANCGFEHLRTYMKNLGLAITARQKYVSEHTALSREDILREPSPGDSRERLNALMEVHAFPYESCEAIRFNIVNALGPNGLPPNERPQNIQLHSKKLANFMQRHLSLEVKYAVALDVVAPHIQTILTPYGESSHERDPEIEELRRQRRKVYHLIGDMMNNEIPVSPENAMDESVLGLSLRFSPEERSMEPIPEMSDEWLHRVMEYNALWSEMCRYKSEQLRVVLKAASTTPELRETLQRRQQEIHEQKRTYFATACKYAQELIERDVYASLPLGGKRPPFEEMDGNCGGNEVHISEGNVPGASSEWVEPNYDQEDENMLSQLLEES
ncbi:hypothetical protein SeLEV6574_g07452, partial [Synchytrium endobioticum]